MKHVPVPAEKKLSGWQASLAVRMAEAKGPGEKPLDFGGLVCTDCGEQATVWRDLGRGVSSCTACEAKHRTRQAKATAPKPQKRSKADRQAAMAARLAASKAVGVGTPMPVVIVRPVAASPEAATATPAEEVPAPAPSVASTTPPAASQEPFVAPPPAPRPIPTEGDVWSCSSLRNGGRRYIRLVKINRRSTTETPFADAVEILADGTRRLDTTLRREYMRTSLEPDGMMPPVYSYEPTITKETETLDLSTSRAAAGDAKETPMSTNHTETVPTTATIPPTKKAALAATAKAAEKKLAATEKKAATPKAVKAAKAVTPKAAKKTARSYTVPNPGTIIHKTYKGKELEPIKALAEGRFSYKGKTYETINELGTHIRGGKPTWAYAFFGLTK